MTDQCADPGESPGYFVSEVKRLMRVLSNSWLDIDEISLGLLGLDEIVWANKLLQMECNGIECHWALFFSKFLSSNPTDFKSRSYSAEDSKIT